MVTRAHIYQTGSVGSRNQGSSTKALLSMILPLQLWNFVTGQSCRAKLVHRNMIFNWSLNHGSSWSNLLTLGPGNSSISVKLNCCKIPRNWEIRFNSLGPSDAIWRWRSWSTLVQAMACCLTAQSHYLNNFWLIIRKVLWHSSEDIIIRRFEDTNQ